MWPQWGREEGHCDTGLVSAAEEDSVGPIDVFDGRQVLHAVGRCRRALGTEAIHLVPKSSRHRRWVQVPSFYVGRDT